jgi:hypothetical protein
MGETPSIISSGPYHIPTDHERRALFAWLKQASSLTAWRRLYTLEQKFSDAVNLAYKDQANTADREHPIPGDWCEEVLTSHKAFAAAIERLARGDRRCFTYYVGRMPSSRRRFRGHFSEGLCK